MNPPVQAQSYPLPTSPHTSPLSSVLRTSSIVPNLSTPLIQPSVQLHGSYLYSLSVLTSHLDTKNPNCIEVGLTAYSQEVAEHSLPTHWHFSPQIPFQSRTQCCKPQHRAFWPIAAYQTEKPPHEQSHHKHFSIKAVPRAFCYI